MTDLTTRLRDMHLSAPRLPSCKLCGEAADRIERLEAALMLISNPGDVTDAEELGYIAREALEDRE